MTYISFYDDERSSPLGCGCRTPLLHVRLGEGLAPREFRTQPGHRIPAPSGRPVIGALLKHEVSPPQLTLYVNIPLGSESPARPMTGIFIPTNFRAEPRLDLILYLHGHHTSAPANPPAQTIDHYWNRAVHSHFDFREGLNASGKNVVLVAPTLGPKSQAGHLLGARRLDWYLNLVLAALRRHGPYRNAPQEPALRNLVLACHSGGGWSMRQLATLPSHNASAIRECWGFDCLYNGGDEGAWANWARSHPSSRLFIHYGNGKTAGKSERLRRMGVPNVFVEGRTSLAHNLVPKTHWLERLRAATFLGNT